MEKKTSVQRRTAQPGQNQKKQEEKDIFFGMDRDPTSTLNRS
jgi:hypothetical protein